MTCVAEKLTPELWEKVKSDLGPLYRLHIERFSLDDDFIGRNLIIHIETGNYMCSAPSMIPAIANRWFFYVMKDRAFCFGVDSPTRTMLEFYPGNEPDAAEYSAFQAQVTEIFGIAGFRLLMSEGWIFVPQFPVLKGSAP